MADVNKINVNGTDYDIADATAREEISELNQSLSSQGEEISEINQSLSSQGEEISEINQSLSSQGEEISEINQSLSDITQSNAGAHNAIYRGKSLGSSVTSAQASAISGATFDDLYIGDYWTISSVQYPIGCFDCWYRCGSTSLTTHNALLFPSTNLYTAPMNASNTTDGGYPGSAMFTGESITVDGTTYTGLTNAISTIQSAFGSYVLTHQEYMANAVTDGIPTGGAWQEGRICDLMTEQMVYGSAVMMQMSSGGTRYYNQRVAKSQLPIFMFNPTMINIRATWWLRGVVSSTSFAFVSYAGNASTNYASSVYGVRPYFLIS